MDMFGLCSVVPNDVFISLHVILNLIQDLGSTEDPSTPGLDSSGAQDDKSDSGSPLRQGYVGAQQVRNDDPWCFGQFYAMSVTYYLLASDS